MYKKNKKNKAFNNNMEIIYNALNACLFTLRLVHGTYSNRNLTYMYFVLL